MEYVVQPGDTLSGIARRFGVSLAALLAVNPEITDPDLIFPGEVVRIPLLPPLRPPAGRCLYVIQSGDTLADIAQRFGVDLTALVHANPQIADPDVIFPGQVIFVPLCRRPLGQAPVVPPTMERPMPMPMHMHRPLEHPGPGEMCPPDPAETLLELELPEMPLEMDFGLAGGTEERGELSLPELPRTHGRPLPEDHRHHRR
ncbi:MAG TPA: LysM peptidoglycan-binding domain-containing protein [Firmicutes bacterium]|nr:LysM peptidoglycan-binding domain-containing protein [Bacillota bacterium]